jgi:hypothetical protein
VGEAAAQVLARVSAAGGRLLRVERAPAPGPAAARASRVLRLTFDVGRVELTAPQGALEAEVVPAGDAAPLPVAADEEDPWWSVLGNPLTRVEPRPDGSLLVQFRPDAAAPKLLALAPEGRAVAVRPAAGGFRAAGRAG